MQAQEPSADQAKEGAGSEGVAGGASEEEDKMVKEDSGSIKEANATSASGEDDDVPPDLPAEMKSETGEGDGTGGEESVDTETRMRELEEENEELRRRNEELEDEVQNLKGGLSSEYEDALRSKDVLIESLQAEIRRMEEELEEQLQLSSNVEAGEQSDEGGEIPYDVLDRLDQELAKARDALLQKDLEIENLKQAGGASRVEDAAAARWKESSLMAQAEVQRYKADLDNKEREVEEERRMRREIESRFEEKLKLKMREAESLAEEVARLRKSGEQLTSVLMELENVKMEARQKLEHKNREISRLQNSLQETQAHRQRAESRVQAMQTDMEQWQIKLKNAEEVRWMAGMNLAKAKAEMDWRQKADQEKDFYMERLKEELERVKSKLMRTEMRKLKVEESLDEALMELRSKKREMEQMKARIDGVMRMMPIKNEPML
ncbi:hypothetical protein GUITHDRAFT_112499 [Guillardia theta CCMP2712]|uniref:Uncharacterized protein n=1 Tax=Guillardia theta (strain CCMP2712) TaxID=905079 RepID=L1J0A9_GUITC|nr:hypothetical protein GUITHDRAFT_112499 [Guillardia theta CCMP2712]EKX41525.1 hypothetical protein GUITHDRAFT_112499 [Guillardia theta CCMP2712]|eukprot:XP_005828505.1 hypothetical protein GUITHDRAFT_112499 [Guillardia theta CCMP2712]